MTKKAKIKKSYSWVFIAILLLVSVVILAINQYSISIKTTTKSKAEELHVSSPQWEHRIKNTTDYYTIDGETFMNSQNYSPQIKHPNQNNKYVDILFVSQNYSSSQLNTFHNDVNKAIRYLISNVEPFKSRREQLRFLYIDNTSDLKCNLVNEYEMCDENAISELEYKTQIRADTTVILINQPIQRAYGAALTQGTSIIFLPNNNTMEETIGHELGHAFAGLRDEYYPAKDYYPIATDISSGVDRNCYNGIPPAPSWKDLVGELDYAKGCGNPDYYRPYKDNMMVHNLPYFDAPSQELILRRLDTLAGKSFDNETPNIRITSSLGFTKIIIKPQVSDNVGIIRVAFFKDGNLYHTEYQSPFTFLWDVSQEPKTTHVFTAKAYDANGNIGTSDPINVDMNDTATSTQNIQNTSAKTYHYARDFRDFIDQLLRQLIS